MKFSVYDKNSSGALIDDLNATVTLDKFTGDAALIAADPNTFTVNQDGNIEFSSSTGNGGVSLPGIIKKVTVASQKLNYFIFGFVAVLVVFVVFIYKITR